MGIKRLDKGNVKGFIGTFILHGQYRKGLVNLFSYLTAGSTKETYRTLQSHDQLIQHKMACCFRIVVVLAYIKPFTMAMNGGFFFLALLPCFNTWDISTSNYMVCRAITD